MFLARFNLVCLVAVPLGLAAQETPVADTTPFRRGQWAAQFGGGASLLTLGVLCFTSPRSAWVLDARVSGAHGHSETTFADSTGDTTITSFTSTAGLTFRVGRRFLRTARPAVVTFFGFGVLGGFSHDAGGSGRNVGESNGWSAGAFGELGGTYLVNDNFGVGVTSDAAVTYNRSIIRSTPLPSPRRTTWSYSVAAPNIRFVATLYF